MRKKVSSRVTLLRQLVGSGWSADAKTLRKAGLSLVYSTAEYCAPVVCHSAHTRLIDSVLNDPLGIVTHRLTHGGVRGSTLPLLRKGSQRYAVTRYQKQIGLQV